MKSISVIIITFNEELNLPRCLESVKWAEEIIIVDSFSTDRTLEIARRYTNKIVTQKWKGFGSAKQLALETATSKWALSLDADEEVTTDLRSEIEAAIEGNNGPNGYYIPRLSNFLGKWMKHGGWYPDYVMRLVRREHARFTIAQVHEELIVSDSTDYLKNPILHYTDPNLERYMEKLNRYTTIAAQELHIKGKSASIVNLAFRPPAMFMKMYLLKLGFLDGIRGFLLAFFSGVHVFTKYAKLWHLNHRQNE